MIGTRHPLLNASSAGIPRELGHFNINGPEVPASPDVHIDEPRRRFVMYLHSAAGEHVIAVTRLC